MDTVAADGPLASAVPDLFKSISVQVPKPVEEAVKQTVAAVEKPWFAGARERVVGAVERNLPAPVKEVKAMWDHWWHGERLSKVADVCLPRRELDALAIEGTFVSKRSHRQLKFIQRQCSRT